MATNYTTSFNINIDDLQFILKQIQIAEASSLAYNDNPLTILEAIMAAYGATAEAAALLPAGLRTVDGTFNNLLIAPTATDPGTSEFGAADTLFPRLTDPVFINELDGDQMSLGPGAPTITNTDYGVLASVADADPRIISNLIVDMSVNNPAAIAAYLSNPLSLEQFAVDHPDMNPVAPGGIVDPLVDLEITNTDLQTIPNQSPDIGLSPGFNAWMTFFGQFFDHGLDLVTKGTNGTVYIPLAADDPLIAGADGILLDDVTTEVNEAADNLPAHLQFMALTRATATIVDGVPQHENTTTSWIDQNQTYTSHASHQVFLREYAFSVDTDNDGIKDSRAVSTGRLIDGTAASGSSAGAIGNWGEVKAQALAMLGIVLDDFNIHNVPLLLTDQYGKFIPGANGYAQVATTTGFVEGTEAGLVLPANTVFTNHAFLNDIAHHAAPSIVDVDINGVRDGIKSTVQVGDADIDANHNGVYDAGIDTLTDVNGDLVINTADFFADDHNELTYDDEMLDSHFITGDGRGNENIALTTVHSIFHSEHNRAVEVNKATLLANAADATLNSADHTLAVAFLNEWLVEDVAVDATVEAIAAFAPADLVWDGERLFQAARFSTEMQYQHMVFEEFARRIQPFVDPFIFTNTAEIDPSIVAEFAHTVYRFGHSMLTGTVDRLDNSLVNPITGDATQDTLLAVFLNPQAYTAGGVDSATINADLIRGLSRDVGNAMDEFIVTDVRSNLLGLPLDLAALNIARGRDTGIPSLNETRAQLYNSTNLADLKPYENWADFAANIKNPMSIINFIAAYGTHASILAETTVDGMRDAAIKLVFGDATLIGQAAIDFDNDRFDFLGATGIYTGGDLGGMNNIDLWIGGLAEANPEFGGMLGTTFNYVFEYQMESLQNGDRMYYLSRTQGLNFLNQLEPNTFADMVMRNTELGDIYSTHLNGLLFVTPDHIFELDRGIAQTDYDAGAGIDPLWGAGEAHSLLTPLKVTRTVSGSTVVDDMGTTDTSDDVVHDFGGTLKFFGGEHVVVGGTEGNDKIWTDKGIDTLWGDGGNDYLNAGTESDQVFGGDGDDIIEDPFGDDFLRGGQGNDVVSSARGFDVMFGEQGQDYIILGQDASEVFAGQDNDFILGGAGTDGLLGNEGDDWIEGGDGLDGISGENSQLFFNSMIIGHDVLNGQGNDTDYDGESGDDIMVQGAGIQRSNGMFGFDWGIHKNDLVAADSDLGIPIFAAQAAFTLRDRFDSVEGLSGWDKDDILTGAAVLKGGAAGFGVGPGNPVDESDLKAKNVHLIDGLADLLGLSPAELAVLVAQELAEEAVTPTDPTAARSSSIISIAGGAEIIIGGGGNDTIKGNLGNDILDGDAWLNVRIKITMPNGTIYSAESMSTDTLVMGQYAGKVFNTDADGKPIFTSPAFGGATLNSLMLNGTINPGSLSIVREILQSTTAATDVDTAVYNGNRSEYTIVRNADGSVTITHTPVVVGGGGALIDDGTDTIRNFERLQFADGFLLLANSAATGTATIIGQTLPLREGVSQLVDTSAIADANGLSGAFNFQWESSSNGVDWTPIVGATDASFVPVALAGLVAGPQADMQLRAVVTFTDAAGYEESITSAPTGFVGTVWDGDGVANAFAGTRGDDIANGNADNDILNGNDGNDILNGGNGADTLNGGNGADTLNGGNGNDVVNGGAGNDTILFTIGEEIDTVNGGADIDTLVITGTAAANTLNVVFNGAVLTQFQGGAITNVESVTADLLGANDTLNYGATAAGVTVNLDTGTASGFTSIANIENVTGGSGADNLTGSAAANTLNGGAGADNLAGGGGNDTYVVDNAGDNVTEEAAGGTDTVQSSVNTTLSTNVENLTLTGAANISGTGNDANNVIVGNTGNNTLSGGVGADNISGGAGVDNISGGADADTITGDAGADIITGDAGADIINGGAAADNINGGAGTDAITGGAGQDTLTGGTDKDTFVYAATGDTGTNAATRDIITDFATFVAAGVDNDIIDLSAIDAINGAGNQTFEFIGTAAFTGAGQLRYVQIGGDTFIQGNINNNTNVDFSIQLTGLQTLGAADFVL